jgi:hypothetical protein
MRAGALGDALLHLVFNVADNQLRHAAPPSFDLIS